MYPFAHTSSAALLYVAAVSLLSVMLTAVISALHEREDKVVLVPWRHMREWKYSSTILHIGTRERLVASYRLRLLYLRRIAHINHRIWGWVDTRAGLDALEKMQNSWLCRESSPSFPGRNPSICKLNIVFIYVIKLKLRLLVKPLRLKLAQ
jgi:hypothetical protein